MSLELREQYQKIYTFCYFKVQNKEVAEDITQETFLKYFSTTSYLDKGKKLAFLYTIARNLCNDYFRKSKQTANTYNIEDVAIDLLKEDITDDLETSISIKTAISKLNFDEQELILLRYTNNLSINEIAEYLNISRFAVYRKLNKAQKQLKSTLRKEDFYE